MRIRDSWFLFSKHLGTTIFHPQFIVKRFERESITLVKKYANGKLIDVGCGRMPYREELEPLLKSYTGVDHPEVSKLYKSGRKPEVLADAKKLPFPDNSFDIGLLLQLLEHVDGPEKVMQEVARVLKPSGILIISLPFLYPLHDMPYDWGRYTSTALKSFISEAGLHVVKMESRGDFFEFWFQSLNICLTKRIYDILSSKKNMLSILYLLCLILIAPIIIVSLNIAILIISLLCKVLPSYPNYFPLNYTIVAKKPI